MLAWSEGIHNGRQKTRNHGYDVIVGGELFDWLPDHPRKLVTLNPKLKSTGAGRYQLLFPLVGCLPQEVFERLSEKFAGTLWHCSRLRSVALLPMIDRGDIRQAIDRCSNIWASLPGAGYGQFEHKADSLIAKIQRSGRNGQRDWWAMRVTAIISPVCYLHHRSACHGLLIITVITPCIYKAESDKNRRTEAGERGNYWHADASAWCCCARCKIHEGVSWC